MFSIFTAKKSAAKTAITLIAAFSLIAPQATLVHAATISVEASSSSSSEAHAEATPEGVEASASSESESSVSIEVETGEGEEVEVEAEAHASADAEASASSEDGEATAEAHSESSSSVSVSTTVSTTPEHKVVVCHATGSDSNPYIEVEVDADAWDEHTSAHSDHVDDFLAEDGECPDGEDDDTFASAMCSASVTVEAGDKATWTAEVGGTPSDFTFEWTGTEGLSGTSVSVMKEYISGGTKTAEVTVTAADSETTSVSCSISVDVEPGDEPEPEPEDDLGSIRICKMIVNQDDEIQTSSDNLVAGDFTVKLGTGSDIDATLVETVTFDATAFTPNESIILGGQDAECVTIDDLEIVSSGYFWSEEGIVGDYELVGYNDQHNTPVDDLGDFFDYSNELFTPDAGDDASRNTDSDGHITLKESRPDRTLVILNSFEEADEPEPEPEDKGTLRVCKVLIDDLGDITTGASIDATFKIDITGPNGFAETAMFVTPMTYTEDNLGENDEQADTECIEYEVEAGKYLYEAETINSSTEFETPKYNDQFDHNVKDLLDFFELTVDGSPEDNDNADGVINIGKNKTRELIVLNQIDKEDTGGENPQCSDDIDNEDVDDLADELDPGCHTDGDPDNPDSYDPNDDDETDPLPTVDLKLNDADGTVAVDKDTEFTLSWTSDNAVTCTATEGWAGDKAVDGNENDSVNTDTTYTITCENGEGETASDSVTADVPNGGGGGGNDDPTVDIKINDTDGTVQVSSGVDFTLSWESDNAVSCVASAGWSGDKAVDGSEPTSVGEDTTFTITCENEDGDTAVDSVTADVPNGGGGGGGGGGSSRRSSGGSVLGASTQCDYLKDFLRIDFDNDPVEVMKLQAFLIYFEGFTNLEVDGVFDQELENAVDAFQNEYFADVLAPWGHDGPTGYVYLTTRKKVNEIYCQKAFPLNADQQDEVNGFRALLDSFGISSDDFGIGGGLFLPETADAAERGDVLGVIDTDLEIGDSSEEANGSNAITTNPRVQEIAASVLALPSDASGWGECLFWFVIAIAIIYLIGTIIVNMQDTAGKTDKQVRTRKLLYFIIGSVVAVILAILLEIFCIVMPLLLVLIILAIGLIWYVNAGNKKN